MTPQEAYKKFQLEINKNDTNTNVKISKGVFVLLYNEQKRKWLDNTIKKREGSYEIESIKEILEIDVELIKDTEGTTKTDFLLPANFFRSVSSYNLASRGQCKNQVLINWFVKPKNLNVLLQNDNHSPSFDYRETIALINKDRITVYKNDFEIEKTYLTYYREPQDINILGYIQLDGTPSVDVSPDISNQNVEEIINLTAAEAIRNAESVEQLQIALQRLQSPMP